MYYTGTEAETIARVASRINLTLQESFKAMEPYLGTRVSATSKYNTLYLMVY